MPKAFISGMFSLSRSSVCLFQVADIWSDFYLCLTLDRVNDSLRSTTMAPSEQPKQSPPTDPSAVAFVKGGKRKRLSKVCTPSISTTLTHHPSPHRQACDACHKSKRRCDGTGTSSMLPIAPPPDSLTPSGIKRHAVTGNSICSDAVTMTDAHAPVVTSPPKSAHIPTPPADPFQLLGAPIQTDQQVLSPMTRPGVLPPLRSITPNPYARIPTVVNRRSVCVGP